MPTVQNLAKQLLATMGMNLNEPCQRLTGMRHNKTCLVGKEKSQSVQAQVQTKALPDELHPMTALMVQRTICHVTKVKSLDGQHPMQARTIPVLPCREVAKENQEALH